MRFVTLARSLIFALVLCSAAFGAIRIATLNCYFLVDPARAPEGQLTSKTPTAENYARKLENLTGLIGGFDVVALQEVGSRHEAEQLAVAAAYAVTFAQGTDTFTGQDVAALVRLRPGLAIIGASRSDALSSLSKHLVVSLNDDGSHYTLLVVHLIRPIGRNAEKHARQLQEIAAWVEAQRNTSPGSTVVVLGDFNNSQPEILALADSGRMTDFAPTHLRGKAIDRIFTTGRLADVAITAPPIPRRANETLLATWTDHFLISATVSPLPQ